MRKEQQLHKNKCQLTNSDSDLKGMGMEILKSGTFIHDWGLNREILLVTQFVVNLIFIETLQLILHKYREMTIYC